MGTVVKNLIPMVNQEDEIRKTKVHDRTENGFLEKAELMNMWNFIGF